MSCLGKVFERCVFKYTFNYLRDYQRISMNQSGFIPDDSTVNQLVNIYHNTCASLDEHKNIQMIFFDISKAFDKVWHKGLLFKLKCVGIDGNLLNWLTDYLSNRKQRVVINGKFSTWKCIQAGVPQGSVLGPLLFLVYINDITNNLSCRTSLFADDTSLSKPIDDPVMSNMEIQNDLNIIGDWANKWKVKFNPLKSESLLVTLNYLSDNTHDFIFQNQAIFNVQEHKHLGLIWNTDATWKSHLLTVISKASKRIDMLRALKFKIQRSSLEKIYFSFIRPLFEYASIVWHDAPRHDIYFKDLEKLQIQAARIVTGTNNYASKQLLYIETNWDTLCKRRENQRLILFYKIVNGLSPPHLYDIYTNYMRDMNPRYFLRNQDIPLVYTRTETFRRSFFPSVIRAWNSLDPQIRCSDTLSLFKMKLKGNQIAKNMYYSMGCRLTNCIILSMKLHCSELNYDLFKNNLTENKYCVCGEVETPFHYLFQCQQYTLFRNQLYHETGFVQELSLDIILNGDNGLSHQNNTILHQAVTTFIKSTKCFRLTR